jgi:hypothetical protein
MKQRIRKDKISLVEAVTTLVLVYLGWAIPTPFNAAAAPIRSKIIDGSTVSESSFPSVARLSVGGDLLCTGTLIAPSYVLTAAHCFYDSRNRRAVGDTDIIVRLNGAEYGSARVHINPTYRPRSAACVEGEIDAAIIELNSVVSGVSPIPLLDSPVGIGWAVTLVGYGTEGNGARGENGNIPPVGFVNYGNTVVEGLGDNPPRQNSASSYYYWRFDGGESNTASGDSGGPALVDLGGTVYLSGITCGGEGNSEFGSYSFNTRADTLTTWANAITGSSPTTTAPSFPAIGDQSAQMGSAFSYTIPVSGSSPISLSAFGLPPGLSLEGTQISGTPLAQGVYSIQLQATNEYGNASGEFRIIVSGFTPEIRVSRVELQFDNDPRSDYLGILGKISVGSRFKPRRARVVVTIGRFSRTFRLDSNGQSTGNLQSYFDLQGQLRGGRFKRSTVGFELELNRAELLNELTTLGFPETDLAESDQRVPLPLSVTLNGVEASTTTTLRFRDRDAIWVIAR